MSIIEEYRKIRKLSLKIHLFEKNIGIYVRLRFDDGYKCIAEPVEMKERECFFRLIGKGIENHPLTSYQIEKIEEIIPMT